MDLEETTMGEVRPHKSKLNEPLRVGLWLSHKESMMPLTYIKITKMSKERVTYNKLTIHTHEPYFMYDQGFIEDSPARLMNPPYWPMTNDDYRTAMRWFWKCEDFEWNVE